MLLLQALSCERFLLDAFAQYLIAAYSDPLSAHSVPSSAQLPPAHDDASPVPTEGYPQPNATEDATHGTADEGNMVDEAGLCATTFQFTDGVPLRLRTNRPDIVARRKRVMCWAGASSDWA